MHEPYSTALPEKNKSGSESLNVITSEKLRTFVELRLEKSLFPWLMCPRRCGECGFWRGEFSPFLVMCPHRSVGNQLLTQTENGSDLTMSLPPFFLYFCRTGTRPPAFLFPLFLVDLQWFM